jgi:N-acetylglucosaminyldiphosphoundecaprenol N-acetyl-beta-D-mannosaminyltransferase
LPERIVIVRCAIDPLTSAQAVDHVFESLAAGRGGWLFTPNLDILRRLTKDPQYDAITSTASLRLADGMPLVWAARLQGTPLPERIAGSEIIWSLCAHAARLGRSVFFLGGNPGAAAAAVERLRGLYPALTVAGIEVPPLGFERNEEYLSSLQAALIDAAPDLVLVGLPAHKQDPLIRRLTAAMPRTWFAGIGVTFSFVAGEVRKPPPIVRRIGLEWFFRLLQEPRRLARRYLLEGVPFAIWLLAHSAANRFRRRAAAPLTSGPSQTENQPSRASDNARPIQPTP